MLGDWTTGATLSLSDAAGVYHHFGDGLLTAVVADGCGATIALATQASRKFSVSLGTCQDGAQQPQTGDTDNRAICAAPLTKASQQPLGLEYQRHLHQLANTATDEPNSND